METWHPFAIHLPIGLVLIWPFVDAAGLFLDREDVSRVGLCLLLLAIPASLLATVTGQAAFDAALARGAAVEVLEQHSDIADLLPWALLVVALIRWFLVKKIGRPAHWVATLLGAILILVVVQVGASGGALVFEHGIGVHGKEG